MPEEFDPYSQWLGVLAHERPIDHYRLLGVARFTSEPAAIAAAADRRMALIRSYQTGPRGRHTQQLLNEIAAAKLCLINPSAKKAYDAMLEGLASATEPPPLATSPAPLAALPARPTPPVPPQSNVSEHDPPRAAMATENEEEDSAERWDAEEPVGMSCGSVVLAAAVVVIIIVGIYVTWQVMVGRGRSPTIDPLTSTEDGGQKGAANDGAGSASLPRDEPVVVFQETDGSVNFTPSVAVLNGGSLRLQTVDVTDVLTGWTSVDDSAVWKCKIIKLPPNGVFRVLVTYRASTDADEGSFKIAINGREKTCQIRGTGEFVTDEHFLAVTRSGVQSLELRSPQLPGGEFDVKGVRLVMSNGEE